MNGFKEGDLENGLDFEIVNDEVCKILDGKLVVTCNGAMDFKSLNIPRVDLDNFEFQLHWKKFTGTRNKQQMKVYQPISLKRLYHHYFNSNIQTPGQPIVHVLMQKQQ